MLLVSGNRETARITYIVQAQRQVGNFRAVKEAGVWKIAIR